MLTGDVTMGNRCLEDFPRLSTVQSPTNTVAAQAGRRYIFPKLRVKCETDIFQIVYKGEAFNSQTSFYPIIQLYSMRTRDTYIEYNLRRSIEYNNFRSVSQGFGGSTILTLRSSIEAGDDYNPILGVYLPPGSTSFYFEANSNASEIFYTNGTLNQLSSNNLLPQNNVLPLITLLTGTIMTIMLVDAISVHLGSNRVNPTTQIISSSRTISDVAPTSNSQSSSTNTVKTSTSTPAENTATPAENTAVPATTIIVLMTNHVKGPAFIYRATIIPIISTVVFGLLVGFIVVTCVLTYKLKKAKATLSERHNNQLTREILTSSPYEKTTLQENQHNSMIINESYSQTRPCIYSRPFHSETKTNNNDRHSKAQTSRQTCESLNDESCKCQSNPSYVPSNPALPQPSLPYHQYEEPDMLLTPQNYEYPQVINSIELPNYQEGNVV